MHLVTGATGLIGSFICRAMLKAGYSLRALRRKTSDMSLVKDIQDEIEWVEGDLLDIVDLEKHMQGVSGVIHSAAFISYDSRDEALMQKINVEGTANIVNVALKQNVSHFLHMSSVAAVGKKITDTLVDETHTITPDDNLTGYARSKWLAEVEVWRAVAEGLPAVVLNPSLVLGPGDLDKSSTQVFKYIWDEKRFYTTGTVNYVDVRDVAEVAVQAINQELTGERFIVSGGSVSYQQLFETIAKFFKKRPPNIKINASIIKGLSKLDRVRTLITQQKPLVTDELAQVARNSHTYNNQKVREALEVDFRPLNETIQWCCEELMKKEEKTYLKSPQ
ncbi:NAD-dependent epimerase/dehydratase family protein [Tunicatimonas pelagia]|uniref:NAD-dependent epimerase/dehydratase family protein n=1 Tax=Tunicatimonas pelagia TaxID=931531 RepID=UPI002666BFB0|nr:NAD-dependent epimerase/dehydratase family protein [Tunicatimonas pelagia]WKN42027.1 NAD-dependent epimerase/dehydratase family protein [Tunicatimonas pelagia]